MEQKLKEYLENTNKDELVQMLYDMIDNKEERYSEYLKGFDEDFKIQRAERIKETPVLIELFNNFVSNIYKPSKTYYNIIKKKGAIDNELQKAFTDEQKALFELYKESEDRILDDMLEQAFIYGYAMSTQMRDEAIKQYPHHQN